MGQQHSLETSLENSKHHQLIQKQINKMESESSSSSMYHLLCEASSHSGWPHLVNQLLYENNDSLLKKTFFTCYPNKSQSDYIFLLTFEALKFYESSQIQSETHVNESLVKFFSDSGYTLVFPGLKSYLFHCLFLGKDSSQLLWPLTFTSSRLLDVNSTFLLQLCLISSKIESSGSWKCLFSTSSHGKSWTVFTDSIQNAQSSLVIIKDKQGSVFGGFASQPWDVHPNFYGNDKSFLFTLKPNLQLFFSSGLNKNYQYYCSGTKTLSNGLGFGGQLDYFALWIKDDFEHGSCRSEPLSTTYSNPLLSSTPDFEIDSVEVWGVLELQLDDRLIDKHKSSVLDQIGEAEFLEMAGKTMYSKDIPREPVDPPCFR